MTSKKQGHLRLHFLHRQNIDLNPGMEMNSLTNRTIEGEKDHEIVSNHKDGKRAETGSIIGAGHEISWIKEAEVDQGTI